MLNAGIYKPTNVFNFQETSQKTGLELSTFLSKALIIGIGIG